VELVDEDAWSESERKLRERSEHEEEWISFVRSFLSFLGDFIGAYLMFHSRNRRAWRVKLEIYCHHAVYGGIWSKCTPPYSI